MWTAKGGSRRIFDVRRSPSRQVAFADFLAEEGEDLQAYGRWCVLAESTGRVGISGPRAADETVDPRRWSSHTWLQWIFDDNSSTCSRLLRAGMRSVSSGPCYRCASFGADTWAMGDLLTQSFGWAHRRTCSARRDRLDPAAMEPADAGRAEYRPSATSCDSSCGTRGTAYRP